MPSKIKIFGISLIAFILLGLWLFVKPKEGINPLLMVSSNIDSVQIYKSVDTATTITAAKDLAKISNELNKIKKVDPELKTDRGSIDLTFYLKNKNKPISVTIMYNIYDSILIHANDLYYKNDSLNMVILTLLKKS